MPRARLAAEALGRQRRNERLRRFDAVIFDMDGTIVEHLLDFRAIRAELGIPPGSGILEAIKRMPPDLADRAERALLEQEVSAARRATLAPQAAETLNRAAAAGLKTALLTRNARQAMEIVLERFQLRFDLARSRHDGPAKPSPDAVRLACRALAVTPQHTCCVGDFRYDIEAARGAGAVSVLLRPGEDRHPCQADYVIESLAQLCEILRI